MDGCPVESPPNYDLLEFIFIALPVILDFLIVVFGMATIDLTLRKLELKSKRLRVCRPAPPLRMLLS